MEKSHFFLYKKLLLIIFAIIYCINIYSNAFAQNTNADKIFNKINRIENQLKTLERGFYKNNTPQEERPLILGQNDYSSIEPRIANLEVNLNDLNKKMKNMRIDVLKLKKENDILRGRVSNLLDDIVKEVEKQRDVDFPINNAINNGKNSGKNNGAVSASSNKINSSSKQKADDLSNVLSAETFEEKLQDKISSSANTPEKAYEIAFNFIKKNDYNRAVKSLNSFLVEFPEHKLASNAYYWLGESYYAQKDFKKSSIKFLKGYNGFPQGRKAPDNLLKLGMSLGQIGQKENACKTFAKLAEEFPNAPSAIKQRLELERYRLYCP